MTKQPPEALAPPPLPFKKCACGVVIQPSAEQCSECTLIKKYALAEDQVSPRNSDGDADDTSM